MTDLDAKVEEARRLILSAVERHAPVLDAQGRHVSLEQMLAALETAITARATTALRAEREKYAPLVALVRRFQETVAVVKAEVGTPLTDEVHIHGKEYAEAHAALEAFDLGKEGDK